MRDSPNLTSPMLRSSLSVRLLGLFQVTLDGQPVTGFISDKVRALLAYLVTEADRPHRREALAGLLWPEWPEQTARTNLRRALANLRQVIGDHEATLPFLLITRQTIQFNSGSDTWIDVTAFTALLEAPGATIRQLEEAVALYRGDFLEGFSIADSAAFEEWALLRREQVGRQVVAALHRLAGYYEGRDAYEQALPYAWRQVEMELWDEPAHRQLMRLLALDNQRNAALAQYETLRDQLAEELSVEPEEETTRLYEQIRDGEIRADVRDRLIRGYELRERIGAGGFGVVYRAYQPSVGREVAIKVILPEYANHPDFIRRFEAEAQLVARLEHMHIVPLYDYWREPDSAYLVMRWLRGGNLRESLRRASWTPEAAARLLDQVASALTVAHRQSVVHRDVKPENILLDEENNGYLSDFGVAKDLLHPTGMTQAGAIVGSPAYVSPEQAQGRSITPQSDLYSLGVVMYQVLTGEHPFPGVTPAEQLIKHLTEPLPPLRERRPDLPHVLEDVIRQATAKEPAERYPDALAFAAAFREAAVGPAVEVITPPDWAVLEMVNPYKGLRAFEEADAADFFGREPLTERLLARLTPTPSLPLAGGGSEGGGEARFLAVVGPSGSGKSSLVKAGLLPALRRGALPGSDKWFVVEMLPGAHPLDELEIGLLRIAADQPAGLMEQLERDERGLLRAARLALPTEESELLLVIDQFEELFTQAADRSEREHLLRSLHAAVTDPRSRVRVVITLRADFYDRPLMHPEFSSLMRQRTEVVVPLTPEELAQAIREPAEQAGAELEPGLVAAIVTDVSDQPGALPMLQYALTELFECREGRLLTREAYQAIGGVSGALARRAEALYAGLDTASQELTRQLFLRLVTLGEGTSDVATSPDTRQRVLRPALTSFGGDPQAMEDVIDAFGKHRLLTFDRDPETRTPTVEIAHEALLREWGRLREWVETSRDDVRAHQRLTAAAAEWINADRDPGFLLRGTRLDQFESWADVTDLALGQVERDYLETSLAERREREAAEAARQARERALERRSRSFLRALVGVLTIATVIALGLMMFAFNQRGEALEAYSLSLAANAQHALSAKDTASALVLALAASRIDRPPAESQRTLMNAAFAPGPRRRFVVEDVLEGAEASATAVDISPDGRTALAGYCSLILSPDFGSVCDPDSYGVFILWDLETGAEFRRFTVHTTGVNGLAFGPDGKTVLSGSEDTTVILWDVTTGREIRRFGGHSGAVRAVAISPDDHTAVTGGRSGDSVASPGELILWDLETGQEIRRFEGNTAEVVDVAFGPDGRTVLASSGEAEKIVNFGADLEYSLILWDVETGEIIRQFEGLDQDAISIAISPDGVTALTGSWDRNGYLWNLKTGERIHVFEGHTDPVNTLAISPDGRRAISGSDDDSLILWDLETGEQIVQFKAHDSDVLDVTLSPDGRTALSSSRNGTLILWDLFDAGEINRFEGHTAMVFDVAFAPDGKRFLSGSGSADPAAPTAGDTSIRLWNLETGREIRRLEGHTGVVTQIAISPDGHRALSASADLSVRLWDLETGEEIRRFIGHTDMVTGIAFSPDGRTGLSCSIDGTLILWDLRTGEAIHHLTGHTMGVWSVAISPDGRTALSGADDSVLILWDLETGEEIRRFLGHDRAEETSVSGIAYLPDGRTAISGGTDGYLIWWDLETGQELCRFGGHSGIRTRVSVSPDGRIAFSSGWDGTLVLWDLETGELVRRFKDPHTGVVFDSAMSPDGRTGLVGSSAQTIIQWQLAAPSLDELLDWVADNRYVRELTCDERELYRIEPLCEE